VYAAFYAAVKQQHKDDKIHLAAEPLMRALAELEGTLTTNNLNLLLIGSRELPTNNSRMHNVPALRAASSTCIPRIPGMPASVTAGRRRLDFSP
jgi:hypothetical protein